MNIPLSTSNLSLWLGVMAIILLVTSEVLFSSVYARYFIIDKKIFRLIAIVFGIGFVFIVIIRAIQNY